MLLPILVAVTDVEHGWGCKDEVPQLCDEARPGTVAVLLRDRQLSAAKRFEWGQELRVQTRARGQLLYVSDRLDLAEMLDADGVHLPADGVPPHLARKMRPNGWISRSGHHTEALGPDDWLALTALFVSPVGAERKGRPALGVLGLGQRIGLIESQTSAAVGYALGGMTAENSPQALAHGATGIVAMGAAWDPPARRALLEALGLRRE